MSQKGKEGKGSANWMNKRNVVQGKIKKERKKMKLLQK